VSHKLLRFFAISRGLTPEKHAAPGIHICELEERPKTSEFYEWYNVLWIEWKIGIAYRKALGRVWKSAWEAHDPEWIDLTLG